MDVVYPVRPGARNEELRYSLRSLVNLPHSTVWLAGYRPPWVEGARHVRVQQGQSKYRNSTANLRAACEHPDLSDQFILMNDDFFIVRPVAAVPTLHRGPVTDVIADYAARHRRSGPYVSGMNDTLRLLRTLGFDEPLSYEMHTPMVVDKHRMLEVLALGADLPVLHKRTLYGNWCRVGGDQAADVKIRDDRDDWDPAGPFISTAPRPWKIGRVGVWVRSFFPDPGVYEAGSPDRRGSAVSVGAGR